MARFFDRFRPGPSQDEVMQFEREQDKQRKTQEYLSTLKIIAASLDDSPDIILPLLQKVCEQDRRRSMTIDYRTVHGCRDLPIAADRIYELSKSPDAQVAHMADQAFEVLLAAYDTVGVNYGDEWNKRFRKI